MAMAAIVQLGERRWYFFLRSLQSLHELFVKKKQGQKNRGHLVLGPAVINTHTPLPRVMGRLVHTGLGSSSLVAHVLPYPPPPPM
jgi:hypothetical protein